MRCKGIAILALIAITGSRFGGYAQTISAGGGVNAASSQSPVAPGSMISILGTNLGILIPQGLPAGPAAVIVATQGRTSNTSTFAVR